MSDNFMFAINAVVPLVLIMALGYFLRARKILDSGFFQGCDKLVFKCLLPATLFCNIYSIENFSHVKWDIVIYSVACIFLICFIGIIVATLTVKNRLSRGVVVQCFFRSNTALVGLPLATSLGGEPAAAIMSVVLGFGVPALNAIAVCVLSVYSDSGKISFSNVVKKILKNPLIIGAFAGLFVLAIRSLIPLNAAGEPVFSLAGSLPFLYETVDTLGSIATPVALVAIGGQLQFSSGSRASIKNIVIGSLGRMVLAPVVAVLLAMLLDNLGVLSLGTADYAVLLPFFGSPVAVSSAIMASEMNSDADLARQYTLWTSLLLIVTLPPMIMVLRHMGLL